MSEKEPSSPQSEQNNVQLTPTRKFSMDTSLSRSNTLRNTEKEKKFLISQFEQLNDELIYFKWVQFKSKKGQVKEKLIAIGNYRIFTLKKSTLGKNKIDQDGHFLELIQVTSNSATEIELKFKNFTLNIFSDEPIGDELTSLVRGMCDKIMHNFPSEALPKFSIEPSDRVPQEPVSFESDDGYIATYKAACNLHRLHPNIQYIEHVKDCYNFSIRDLKLHDINEDSRSPLNLLPVATSLRFNNFFTKLSLVDIVRKEAVSVFAITIASNKHLTRLELVRTDSEEGFSQFAEALEKNAESKLIHIDLSGNRLGDKGLGSLVNTFKKLTRGLKTLKLSNCGLEPKGISQLMHTFDANHDLSLTIEELDLSFNLIGPNGSNNLASWISNCKEGSKNLSALRILNLASTQIDFYTSLQAITSSILDKLESLDLSENKITDKNIESLVELLSNSRPLKHIILQNTGLIPELIEQIFLTLNKNDSLDSVEVDISQNDLAEKGAKALAKTLRYSKHISGLNLHLCNLKKEGVIEIIKSIFDNSTIKHLNLSDNIKSSKSDLVSTLVELISNGNLESLNISSNNFGKDIDPILKALSNSKIHSISVANNGIGDKSMSVLSESLKTNSKLHELSIEHNSLTLSGIETLHKALNNNQTLYILPHLKLYYAKFLQHTKKPEEREKITKIFDELNQNLRRNKELQKDH